MLKNTIPGLEIYKNKRVLITGHTGFKGSWLAVWLNMLGAKVTGYALDPKTDKDNFLLSKIGNQINDIRGDIRDKDKVYELFEKVKPEIIFHLAAQPLLIESYNEPAYTYETNIQGTVNILEAIRNSQSAKLGIFITTDKVYENKMTDLAYNENDRLGGYDPYSSSKAAAELVIASYRNSFFNTNDYENHKKSISSVRAGNVIGGGDWSKNRIIPDCIKAIENNKTINIRKPDATRPWLFVTEALSGYLQLGSMMLKNPTEYSSTWNFGPEPKNAITVKKLTEELLKNFKNNTDYKISQKSPQHETNFLSLDINKAKQKLNWKPVLNFAETIKFTADWYKNYKKVDVSSLCKNQINEYCRLWKLRNEN